MPYSFADLVAHQRRRWMRPDAHLFARPAAVRIADRDAADWRQRLLHPDHKLWNFHVPTNARPRSVAEQARALGGQGFVAELARVQARHDSLRRAFVDRKQQRQRERAFERVEAERLRRRYDAAWDKFIDALHRYWQTHRKAGFDPNQPRAPAGNADGGQWTRVAGADKPRFGRGTIAAVLAEAAKRAIEAYRTGNSLWDLFGSKIGTVGVTTIDGQEVFGSNSTSPTYDAADRVAALELRDRLIEKYPDILNAQEVGRRPNDAFFHAETTVLTRAARMKGGTLAGRTIEVHVDRKLCPSCGEILPFIGLELGDPTVTFVEPTGKRKTMRAGAWIAEGD